MDEIIEVNCVELGKKKKRIIESGVQNFHVVSDFDRTLTYAFVNGEKIPAVISELRARNYISKDYSREAQALAQKYHPIEIDSNVLPKEKEKAMYEWWTKHFELLVRVGLNKSHIEKVVESDFIKLRDGVSDFLNYLYEKKVPLVIMSSSGLGGDSIKMILEKNNCLYENISVISNEFIWDENGRAMAVKEPIIHVLNKKEVSIKNLPIYLDLLKRKNVLLLGDGVGDVDMANGFSYENLIKVGFLNYEVEKNLEEFKNNFDVVILGDGEFEYINNFIKKIK